MKLIIIWPIIAIIMNEKEKISCGNDYCRRSKGEDEPCFIAQTIRDQAESGAQSKTDSKWDPESWDVFVQGQSSQAFEGGCGLISSVWEAVKEARPPLKDT